MSENPEVKKVLIRINLNEYLDTLRAREGEKPINQRRDVPSLADLVRLTGLNRASLYNFAANRYESARLDILAALLNTLRQEGFNVTISDLLREHPIDSV